MCLQRKWYVYCVCILHVFRFIFCMFLNLGWFIRRALATPNSIISIKFGSGAMQARRIKPIFQLSSATAERSTDFAGRSTLARF